MLALVNDAWKSQWKQRWRSGALGLAVLLAGTLARGAQGAETLNVFIYSEYLPGEVVAEFERRFGCKVVVDLFEDGDAMLAKVQAGGTALYDVVAPADYIAAPMIKQGLLAPLRHENIPNLKNLEPKFRALPFDPGNRFTAAYQWGTVGIYLRAGAEEKIPDSWSLIFDEADQPGPFLLPDSMRDAIGAALQFRGQSPNSTDAKQLKAARDLLTAAKQRSLGFAGSVGGRNQVLDKSARAAVIYSGEAGRGMLQDPGTRYIIPKEGSIIWTDTLAILAKASHRDLAEKFINFILEPEIGAQISNTYQFSTPNAEAKKLVRPELLKNQALNPPEEVLRRLVYVEDLGRDLRLYNQVWTSVKSN